MMDIKPAALTSLRFEAQPVIADIAVLIPTLGRDLLQESLARIAQGGAWPGQLVVVDQGSNPAVQEWIDALRTAGIDAEHLRSTQRGRSAGINRGLERIRTAFVIITDDDCFVDQDWLKNMAQRLHTSPEHIITGRVEAAGDTEGALSIVTSRVPKTYYHPVLRAQPLIGGNMGISMANVARIGPFDEHPSVHSAEDSDWGYRALRLGIPIVYDPDIVVHHYSWRNPGQRQDRLRHYALTQGGFYGKYLLNGDPMIWMQTARDLVRAPLRWLRGTLKRDADTAASGRADMRYMLPGIIAGLRRRHIGRDIPPSWPRSS
jgi:GT2 family glycosyltransferase